MSAPLDAAGRRAIFETMLVMRRFEETVIRLAEDGQRIGHFHVYIGQEATGATVLDALGPDDHVLTTHRNHGHVVGRGADPAAALAEILGRATGLNGGRGGTLHLTDRARGILSTSAVVGGSLSLAIGAGYALKRKGGGRVAAVFFGDGALEEGVSYEAQNFAALYALPVLFVCENNTSGALAARDGGYPGATSAAAQFTAVPACFGIPTWRVDGTDIDEVHQAVGAALERCRSGAGPAFIEAITERWAGSKPLWPTNATGYTDIGMATGEAASAGEHRAWYERYDPVLRTARALLAAGVLTQDDLRRLDRAVSERLAAAAKEAVAAPLPAPESAFTRVFA